MHTPTVTSAVDRICSILLVLSPEQQRSFPAYAKEMYGKVEV
jgi:hypothetical protein